MARLFGAIYFSVWSKGFGFSGFMNFGLQVLALPPRRGMVCCEESTNTGQKKKSRKNILVHIRALTWIRTRDVNVWR